MLKAELVGKHWHRLLREAVESPILEVFQSLADVVLRDRVSWWLWHHGLMGTGILKVLPT